MPIFEYICQECQHKFEALVFGKDKLLVHDQFVQHMANTESAVLTDPGVVPPKSDPAQPTGGAA